MVYCALQGTGNARLGVRNLLRHTVLPQPGCAWAHQAEQQCPRPHDCSTLSLSTASPDNEPSVLYYCRVLPWTVDGLSCCGASLSDPLHE